MDTVNQGPAAGYITEESTESVCKQSAIYVTISVSAAYVSVCYHRDIHPLVGVLRHSAVTIVFILPNVRIHLYRTSCN